jgi:hypothetical protein
MGNESFQVEMTMDEVRQFMQTVVGALSTMAANYRPLGPFVTVEDRCKERWPAATKKNRRRVRDVLVSNHVKRLGRHPYKMTGYSHGTFMVEQEHLSLLDEAIDTIRDEVEKKESTPLFPRRPR